MKKYIIGLLAALFALYFNITDCFLPQKNTNTLRICTYNIRRKGSEPSNQYLWQNRKGLVFDMINAIHPDVMGLQEVVKEQLDDLQTVLADYEVFGEPRSAKMEGWLQRWVMKHPKAKDEYNPISYNTKKVKCIKSGNFGINPRAHLFTAYLPRICTWGQFEDIATGKKFYVYNTHLDKDSSLIRKKQISKILKHIEKKTKENLVVLTGDFNNRFKGRSKQRKLNRYGFVNSKNIARV